MSIRFASWVDLYQRFSIELPWGEPVPKPSDTQLDNYEVRIGRKLPQSYRDFIRVFGPGTFSVMLQVAAPGYDYLGSDFDIDIANKLYGYTEVELEQMSLPSDTKALLRRLWYFGLESGRNWMAWDPMDCRDEHANDYAIYRVVVAQCSVQLVSTSFHQLVVDVCSALSDPSIDYDEEELGPRLSYEPATSCTKT